MLVVALAAALLLAACGLDADEETSTGGATTPAITGAATGPSGPSGPSGPTGATGEQGGAEQETTGAGLGTEEPEPAG